MAKNFHNGADIIAKHYTIFLGEEILEFFMVPTVKTHFSVLVQKIPLTWSLKVQLASLTGSNRGQYHSGPLESAAVAYPGILFGGGSTNSVEDRENRGSGDGSPLVRGSGGSCNLVQEISFHIVKFS
jgi:hypothetical protein